MTGRELLLKAVRNEPTPRPAWLPFVGCHGGRLIGRGAAEYLQSAELLFEGLSRACDLYRPDGLPVVFDLQVEAEVLGCALNWADDVPPSVTSHPLAGADLDVLPAFDLSRGRIPTVLRALDLLRASQGAEVAFYGLVCGPFTLRASQGAEVAFYGLVCGPFTLALHLLGNDIFLEMFDDPERVDRILAFSADVAVAMAHGYLEHGADVIAVVDPMTSQISPKHFQSFVTPHVNRVFDAIRAAGGLSSMFVCGDVTRNLELMCRTHADNVSVDEQVPIDRLRSLCEASGKSFGGNIKLTSVLLLGDERDAKLETIDVIEKAGGRGFVLAPGCDLPYHTPPKNLQAVAEMVHDEYARQVARETLHARDGDAFDDVAVPDYGIDQAVIVDVITLDSTSCAPCQYMMEAVERATRATPVRTFVNEHKIKVREGLGMMVRLGVKNLPTICIDGEVAFASIIPDQARLVKAIEDAARAKTGRGSAR